MKKPLSFLLLISLLLSAPLSGCSGAEESAWQKGQKALAEENYGDAVAVGIISKTDVGAFFFDHFA